MSQQVLLGFPGALIENDAATEYTTKVGGSPVVSKVFPPDTLDSALCGVCGIQLALILQTHAPLTKEKLSKDVKERWIYLFGCVQKGCGNGSKSWRAIRLQRFPDVHDTHETGLSTQAEDQTYTAATRDAESTSSPECNVFSMEGLKTALESSAKQRNKKKSRKHSVSAAKPPEGIKLHWGTLLPEFHIYAETERPGQTDQAAVVDRDHIQQSLDRYERQTKIKEDTAWQNETYEKPGFNQTDGGAFWKFQRHLSSYPLQCVRYSFHGPVLNPTNKTLQPDPCHHCGNKRVFEMQLMPHLINALYEAAEWIQSDNIPPTSAPTQTASQRAITCFEEWDWSSIAVFTCSASCGVARAEEQVCIL